ncbi:MAG: hypothetical protein JKY96_08575 [Phycisphaerales bacterium]|nr:hypothetical protein [Phycisphaerales bacterium]
MKITVALFAVAGLAAAANAGVASVIASTSFENGFVGNQYQDTGDSSVDHDLFNNAGESAVDFTASGGEMGVDAYYRNTRGSNGLTDGDFVGFTNFTGTVGAFTDGIQGYQMSDADGTMGINFDTVNFAGTWGVTMDFYITETGWESDDSIRVWITGDAGTIDILNTIGSDIDDLLIEDSWLALSLDLSAYTNATLHVELESNSGSEAIYIDNVVFSGIPTPGTAALLGLGGLVATRRRRA